MSDDGDVCDLENVYELEQEIMAELPCSKKRQKTLPVCPMQPILDMTRSLWKTIKINEDYVPSIGTFEDPDTKTILAPVPATATSKGKVLALRWPCARGKSTAFRTYMKKGLDSEPKRRYLLLSANIGYGRNLTSELATYFPNHSVGFYKDEKHNLSSCQIVVCSLESIWKVASEYFDDILLDEVRSLARLVGGETLDLQCLGTLRCLCTLAPRVTVCDADLDFKSCKSEDTTLAQDFVTLIVPSRKVLKFETTHPGPQHLVRTAVCFFSGKKNQEMWFNEITEAASKWHASRTDEQPERLAINVGTKGQRKQVCEHLHKLKVPFLHYDGESPGEEKLNLSDPDKAWSDVGAIVATTTLSIGVDPKTTTFGRVFWWTSRMGCLPLAQMQAAFRPQRFPFDRFNPEFCVLFDCIDPEERTKQVREGKARPTMVRTFKEEFRDVVAKKGRRTRCLALEEHEGGGRGRGLESMSLASDLLLRCIAHNSLELHVRRSNHFEACKRVFDYHGVTMSFPASGGSSGVEGSGFDFAGMPTVELADDQEFAALADKKDKMEWALNSIFQRGENAFRQQCFGYATPESISAGKLTSREQMLVEVYFLTNSLDKVPKLLDDDDLYALHPDTTPEDVCTPRPSQPAVLALLEMEKPGVMEGLRLNAHTRCLSAQEQLRSDDADRGSRECKLAHSLLKVGLGARMILVSKVEELLSMNGLIDGGSLSQDFVDIANRDIQGEPTHADIRTIARLRELSSDIFTGTDTTSKKLSFVLKDIATGCGLNLTSEKINESREIAASAGRPRKKIFTEMWFERKLPDIVDDWLVWSPRLCSKVRAEDWELMHANVDADNMQGGFLCDEDIAPAFEPFTRGDGSQSVLMEMINGGALAAELSRLRLIPEGNFADDSALQSHQRRKAFCEALDGAAQPANGDGVRLNYVSYGKNMGFGRRTASYPSMQQCPSSLRPSLVGGFGDGGGEHDIDMVNCHPTLMLRVATRFPGVTSADLPTLAELVSNRNVVLDRIAKHYSTSRSNAKVCVLRVMNGGTVQQWIKDVNCAINRDSVQDDLRNLIEEMVTVRKSFFEFPELKELVVELRKRIKIDRDEAARVARARASSVPLAKRREAVLQAEKAEAKANARAVDRSVFSFALGEVEDKILNEIERYMTRQGWTISSRIYDGLHVRHRTELGNQHNERLEKDMKDAEKSVREQLGYGIQLLEKALFGDYIDSELDAMMNVAEMIELPAGEESDTDY